MYFPTHSLSNASRTQIDGQLATATAVAEHTLYAFGELTELNLAAAAASLQDVQTWISRFTAMRDMSQVFQTLQAEAQPTAEKFVSYARHAGEIGTQMQTDIANALNTRVADTLTHLNELTATLVNSVPPGMGAFAEAAKAQVTSLHSAHDKLAKANQQMLDEYHHQLIALSEQFSPQEAPVKSAKPKKSAAAASE